MINNKVTSIIQFFSHRSIKIGGKMRFSNGIYELKNKEVVDGYGSTGNTIIIKYFFINELGKRFDYIHTVRLRNDNEDIYSLGEIIYNPIYLDDISYKLDFCINEIKEMLSEKEKNQTIEFWNDETIEYIYYAIKGKDILEKYKKEKQEKNLIRDVKSLINEYNKNFDIFNQRIQK